jgi:hypothetical protein
MYENLEAQIEGEFKKIPYICDVFISESNEQVDVVLIYTNEWDEMALDIAKKQNFLCRSNPDKNIEVHYYDKSYCSELYE